MRRIARGRTARRVAGKMNRLETKYAEELERRRLAGEVSWYAYEALKLRLADRTFWTPDFFVMLANGELEVHECKGFWENASRIKTKVVAETYPFRVIAIKLLRGQWVIEEF